MSMECSPSRPGSLDDSTFQKAVTKNGHKYYEYGGDEDVEERGLMIGGYELAWLADLVASYILENTEELFEET